MIFVRGTISIIINFCRHKKETLIFHRRAINGPQIAFNFSARRTSPEFGFENM
jgi:hypothetical protein